MRIGGWVLASMVVGLIGCGSDDDPGTVCERAYNKEKDCGEPVDANPPKGECSGSRECIAKCKVAAPCAEIHHPVSGDEILACASLCQ